MPCIDVKGITSSVKDELSFIKRCYWKNEPISCAAIFQKRPTDRGMCCSFNMKKAEKILKSSKYTKAISLRQVEEAKMGFEDSNLPSYYNKNQEPLPEPGRDKGLTLVVDRHSEKLSRGTVMDNFQGFVTIIDDNSKYPMASVNSLIAIPGYENYVKVNAIHMEANKEIQKYSPKERKCYFPEEFKLDMHQQYSQSNCIFECKIKFASKCIQTCSNYGQICDCQNVRLGENITSSDGNVCAPWFYPVIDKKVGQMCNPWNTRKFQQILSKQMRLDECNYCLPDCTTTKYDTTISYAALQKCDHTNIGSNTLCDLVNSNMNPAPWTKFAQNEFKSANMSLPTYIGTTPTSSRMKVMDAEMANYLIFKSNFEENPTYDAYEKDVAIINVLFGEPHILKYVRHNRMNWFDFLSQIGGSIGLAMGLSMVSLVEIIYWFTIRLFRNY